MIHFYCSWAWLQNGRWLGSGSDGLESNYRRDKVRARHEPVTGKTPEWRVTGMKGKIAWTSKDEGKIVGFEKSGSELLVEATRNLD